MENKKLGRPTDSPKEHMLRVRLDIEHVKMLKSCTNTYNASDSEIVRRGIRKIYEESKSETFKVIIAGGRDFTNYQLLYDSCIYYLKDVEESIEIVSGGAKGADLLGEQFANEMNYKLTIFKAEWDSLGKSAGHIRNKRMAEYADVLIAFYDGKSKGTGNMISTAIALGLSVRVINY